MKIINKGSFAVLLVWLTAFTLAAQNESVFLLPTIGNSPEAMELDLGQSVPVGHIIWLRASNSKYICADKYRDNTLSPLFADRSVVNEWEKFEVVDAGNGFVALKALANGKYVTVNVNKAGNPLEVTKSSVSPVEKFKWITIDSNKVALRANVNGMFIGSQGNEQSTSLFGRSIDVQADETFDWGVIASQSDEFQDIARTSNVRVYPNPFSSVLHVVLDERDAFTEIQIFDISGKVIFSQDINNQVNIDLNTRDFASNNGTYFLRLTSDETVTVMKILKK